MYVDNLVTVLSLSEVNNKKGHGVATEGRRDEDDGSSILSSMFNEEFEFEFEFASTNSSSSVSAVPMFKIVLMTSLLVLRSFFSAV